ncbi:MAG: rRNA maturation RNase YbeY [Candidatus Kerfeldbacteria bacterium]|nr:rRNA maturation RNase YbeY [Candidatus Kerfeldbacteria bacterium]
MTSVRLPPGLEESFRRLLGRLVKLTGKNFGEVNVALAREPKMRQLNRSWRHHDRVTDVLSFAYNSRPPAGDIIICLAQAARQASRHGHSLKGELQLLFTHGCLHLAGYDHVKLKERQVMRSMERQLLQPN